MRLRSFIFLELVLATSLVVGGVWGLAAGGRWLMAASGRNAGAAPRPVALAPLPRRRDLSPPLHLPVATEAAGTFLGMSDEILLERMRTQSIVSFKLNKGGSSLSFRLDFADGSRAAWKPAQTNLQTIPRKEVAAYRLNRLLGLNSVPPAATRAVSRDELLQHLHPETRAALPRIQAETVFLPSGKTVGAASYWIPVIKDSGFDTPAGQQQTTAWLTLGSTIPPDRRDTAAQLSDLAVFDFLTSNPDRYSGGNIKMSGDGAQLFFMDNTMSFFPEPQGNDRTRMVLQRTQRFSRRLYQALDRVDEENLLAMLTDDSAGGYEVLTPAEIRALLARRELVKHHIDQLAIQFGAKNVLAFP